MENRGLLKLYNASLPKKELDSFFSSLLDDLDIIRHYDIPNSVFYEKDNETFFELRESGDNSFLIVNYNEVWSVLYSVYGLNTDTGKYIKEKNGS